MYIHISFVLFTGCYKVFYELDHHCIDRRFKACNLTSPIINVHIYHTVLFDARMAGTVILTVLEFQGEIFFFENCIDVKLLEFS